MTVLPLETREEETVVSVEETIAVMEDMEAARTVVATVAAVALSTTEETTAMEVAAVEDTAETAAALEEDPAAAGAATAVVEAGEAPQETATRERSPTLSRPKRGQRNTS